jgi:hypothetical protein
MVLPEDLRSELLKSYGRDEFANYHRNILKAIETWRRLGVWRVPIDKNRQPRSDEINGVGVSTIFDLLGFHSVSSLGSMSHPQKKICIPRGASRKFYSRVSV